MTTLAKLKVEAAKVGGTVEKEKIGITTTVRVTAPAGHIWNEGDVHQFVDDVYTGPNDYKDLLSRVSFGCRKCEDPDCDWCCEEEDDTEHRCAMCGRELDNPADPLSTDCGGHCLKCMQDAGDPEAKKEGA